VSLRLVRVAASIEQNDDFHLARLLLLLDSASGKTRKPIQGIMKLAKLDFLLRYPNALARVQQWLGVTNVDSPLEEEINTVEAKMIRFRYGPWDDRYRKWIGLLTAKGLVTAHLEGRTVNVALTEQGQQIARQFAAREEFKVLANRSRSVTKAVGSFSSTKLKDFVYEVFPEIIDMRWGRNIEI
jgi:hypothetical protein